MHSFKRLGVLAVLAFALSATVAASASAAAFTYSATGSLSGKALETQVFTTAAGQLKCNVAETSGTISSTDFSQQHYTVNYKNCTAFGFASVHVSPATYQFTANGTLHVKNTITINVTFGGCHQTVGPQTVGSLNYANNGGKLKVTFNLSGITYTTTGGLCGASGSNGTFTGANEIERVGGGSISHDP